MALRDHLHVNVDRGGHIRMSQNLLNDFVGNAQPVKIRSQPAPKRVSVVPRNLLRFESGLNHFSHQRVEVQRVPPEISKNKSLGRIS